MLKEIYNDVQCQVRAQKGEGSSGSFSVGRALRQGCILSTTLFSLFIDEIGTALKANERGVALGRERIAHLLYADDLVLIESREEDLQKSLDLVGDWCEANGLVVNTSCTICHMHPDPDVVSVYHAPYAT